MALYGKLYALLNVTTLTTNVYPVILPQAAAFPALTYQRISADRVYSLSGYSTAILENARMQVDCWATSFETVKTLARGVRRTVDYATSIRSNCISDQDFYEPDTKIWRVSMDFSIWDQTTS